MVSTPSNKTKEKETEDAKYIPSTPALPSAEVKMEGDNSVLRFSLASFGTVILFMILLTLVAFLPISNALKFWGLVIGSFIIEDVHHTLKRIWVRH